MGISYNPSIVTEGLVLGLDPQSTRSYVGSGTTWTDLTNRGNSGTLTNGPVFIPGGPFNNSGGSVYFDGTTDYLTVAETGSEFTFGTGDFTIEFWVYRNNTNQTVYLDWRNVGGNQGARPTIYSDGSNLRYYSGGERIAGTDLSANTWHHVALCRSGTSTKMFVNGTQSGGTYSDSTTYLSPLGSEGIYIGAFAGGSYDLDGYISNFRIIKGTALYTADFTPSTGPLEAIDDTVLLTCQGGAITDNGPNSHAITVNNDAKAITASAFEFDGSNDYAVTSSNTDFLFGTEEFAIEWWEYFTDGTGYAGHIGVFEYGGGDDTAHIWTVSGSFHGYPGSWTSIAMQPISNQWAHYVVTGTSGDIRFYQNGELKDTKTWDWSATSSTANFAVGGTPGWSFGNYAMAGKISAVKVYKGKSFTEDEVKRNFSALRGRYGI